MSGFNFIHNQSKCGSWLDMFKEWKTSQGDWTKLSWEAQQILLFFYPID